MDEILNPGTWAAVRGRSKSNNDMVASKLRDETEGFEPPFPLDEDLAKELDDERDAAHRAEPREDLGELVSRTAYASKPSPHRPQRQTDG